MEKKVYRLVDVNGGSYHDRLMEAKEAEECNERVRRYGFKWVVKDGTPHDPDLPMETCHVCSC